MALVVTLLGVAIALFGLLGAARPAAVRAHLAAWHAPSWRWIAVGVRVVLGIFFLLAAPGCRLPIVVQGIGGIALVAALVLAGIGRARFEALVAWWLGRDSTVRASCVFALAFGALLVYAGG